MSLFPAVTTATGEPLVAFFTQGKARARMSSKSRAFFNRKIGKYVAQTYKDKTDDDWMAYVHHDAVRAMAGRPPFDGALRLVLIFSLARPASASPRKRPFPTVKPDYDNLSKSVGDALKGILFVDDQLIVDATVRKRYLARAGVFVGLFRQEGNPNALPPWALGLLDHATLHQEAEHGQEG